MSRNPHTSRDRRVRKIASLADKIPTAEDLAWWRYRNGLLRDADLDYLEPTWLAVTPWQLAALARPFGRLRMAGFDVPRPDKLPLILGYILSYPPSDDPPPELVRVVSEAMGQRRAVGKEAIRLHNYMVLAHRAMGGVDGERLRAEIAAGMYDPSPKVLADDPQLCPLKPTSRRAERGCICMGGSEAPPCCPQSPTETVVSEATVSVNSRRASRDRSEAAARRGQTRPTVNEERLSNHAGATSPEATEGTVSMGTQPVTGARAEEPPEPYSEPADNPPPPRRRKLTRPQTLHPAHRRSDQWR